MASRTDPTDFLPVAPQDLQLLLAVRRGALHGYAIMRAVESQSDGRVRIELGSLYRILHRLERAGLIAEAAAANDPASPGRDRRFYRTTTLGKAVIAAELERLRRVLELATGVRAGEARP